MSEENNNVKVEETVTTSTTTNEVPKVEATKVEAVTSTNSNDNLIAASAYLLFFVPLLVEPKSAFKTFHANQGLLLLIFLVVGQIVGYILMFVLIGFLIVPLVYLASFIYFILGIINALNGKQERLPLIGQWDLIK